MKVLFWGTPAFALSSLRALLGEGHDVVGVVTQPDKPAGRGRELRASAVKQCALEERIPVLQPDSTRDAHLADQIRHIAPDISVVVAYGQFLPKEVLDLPPHGSINVHASLLPELRGAAPINWAIMRGFEQTGVTVQRMVPRMDAGPILFAVPEPIGPDETATDLTARLSEIGAEALIETLALLEDGAIKPMEQDEARASLAPRLTREDARIDWTQDALTVSRRIRGLDESPGAWTLFAGEQLKMYRPRIAEQTEAQAEPGTVVRVHPEDASDGLLVACGDGALWIREVKPAGKRRMTSAAWLRGRAVERGYRLG